MWASEALAGEVPRTRRGRPGQHRSRRRLTAQAHRAGVVISTGTDYETDAEDPFPALYDELAFLVDRCGMSRRCRRSARPPLIGARSAGAEDVMGTVEAGELANLVVLEDDPLATSRTCAPSCSPSSAAAASRAPTSTRRPRRRAARGRRWPPIRCPPRPTPST